MKINARFPELLYLKMIMCFVADTSLAAEVNMPNPAPLKQFELVRGHKVAVCEAYAAGLNAIEFKEPPYCDRPQLPENLGFDHLSRRPLSDSEIANLYPPVEGLLSYDDEKRFFVPLSQQTVPRKNYDLAELVHGPQRDQQAMVSGGRAPLYYLVSPDADLDDDGKADRLLVWKARGFLCGAHGSGGPERVSTHVVALDANDRLDVSTTRGLFTRYSARPGPEEKAVRDARPSNLRHSFQAFADSMGVVRFKGKTYIDAFDSEGVNLLLLDLRRRQISEVCVVHWN